MKNFKEFSEEDYSNYESDTDSAIDGILGMFRGSFRIGATDDPFDDIPRESVFVPSIDKDEIKNGLISLGYEYVVADVEPEDGSDPIRYEGFLRGFTDVLITSSSRMIKGTSVPGFSLGVFSGPEEARVV